MAVRIVGVDLPQNKRGEISLTYIYGIGRSSAKSILEKAGVDCDIKVQDWTDDQAAKVREVIQSEYKVEGDLRSEIQLKKCCKFVIYPELWHVMAQRHQTSGIVFLGNKWGNSGEENSPKNEFCKRPHRSVRLYKIHFFYQERTEAVSLKLTNFIPSTSGVSSPA